MSQFALGPEALLSAIANNPAAFSLQQQHQMNENDALAQFLQLDTMPSMIDDWLADELHHSGLLTMPDTKLPIQDPVLPGNVLPHSPPLTASPENQSQKDMSRASSQVSTPIPLFPEIASWPASPIKPAAAEPRPLAPRPRNRPVPIMPKTEATIIAPQVKCGDKRKAAMTDKEQDEIALKRQRNTDAARRSRLKKLLKMEALEKRVNELEGDNTRLTTRVAVLESEKSGLESKDKELQERIRVLEEQLAEAHRALTAKCSH